MLRSSKATPLEILVVDDDKVVALLHKNQLRSSKIEPAPIICGNGKEALDYLLNNDRAGKHFLIFLDLNMPLVDGWKFLKKLKKDPLLGKAYVVIVTSSINQKDYQRAQTYEQVIYFCRKPLGAACMSKIKSSEVLRPFFLREAEEH